MKACIFDLDGVIVDTAKYHYLAWKELAGKLGFFFSESDNERLKGVSRMASLEILLEIGGIRASEAEKEQMATEKNKRYVEYILHMKPEEILPGVKDFLAALRLEGIKIALGSASKNAGLILRQTGIADLFDAVADGTNVSKAKPDPEVFLKAAGILQTEPSSCVVFEDAVAGVEAAHRGGMVCIGVGNPAILTEADAVIPGFENLTVQQIRELFCRKAD